MTSHDQVTSLLFFLLVFLSTTTSFYNPSVFTLSRIPFNLYQTLFRTLSRTPHLPLHDPAHRSHVIIRSAITLKAPSLSDTVIFIASLTSTFLEETSLNTPH